MDSVGLGELRRDATGLVRRVEAGEEITITVDGGPRARLVPVDPVRWVRWDDLAGLFRGSADPTWEQDRDLLDDKP